MGGLKHTATTATTTTTAGTTGTTATTTTTSPTPGRCSDHSYHALATYLPHTCQLRATNLPRTCLPPKNFKKNLPPNVGTPAPTMSSSASVTPWLYTKALATSPISKFMSPKTTKPSVEASAAACRSVASTTWMSKSRLNLVLFSEFLPGISMPVLIEPDRVWLSPTTHLCGGGGGVGRRGTNSHEGRDREAPLVVRWQVWEAVEIGFHELVLVRAPVYVSENA